MGNSSPLRKTIRDDDLDGMKVILEDAGEGSPDIINEDFTADCLIKRERNIQSPLHTCVARRRLQMTETLIQYGADVNMGGRNGMSPLHYAAKNGDVKMCQLLVKYGADSNMEDNSGQRPIHAAAASDNSNKRRQDDVLQYLVEEVGSEEGVNVTDMNGRTPLHVASWWGYDFLVKWFLEHGANRNLEDKIGRTPLEEAKRRQQEKTIELLVEH